MWTESAKLACVAPSAWRCRGRSSPGRLRAIQRRAALAPRALVPVAQRKHAAALIAAHVELDPLRRPDAQHPAEREVLLVEMAHRTAVGTAAHQLPGRLGVFPRGDGVHLLTDDDADPPQESRHLSHLAAHGAASPAV